RYGARGFPSFVFRYGERETMLRGYQSFPAMQAVIDMLSGGRLQGRAPARLSENLLGFIRTYGRAAPVELATVFDLAIAELDTMLAGLAETGLIRRVEAGNGYFWESVSLPVCDAESGICTL
ncbi:MAG TPA: hypothetical protein VN639_20815, partial [Azonexus sp.]|nr:hypothetical protein [Azonexus sp.]